MLKILVFLTVVSSCLCVFRFDNYTLYKVLPKNVDQIKTLQALEANEIRFDFWTDPGPKAESVSILSSPKDRKDLEEYLNKNAIDYGILFHNIQELIDKQTVKPYTRGNLKSMTFDAYHDNDQINDWLDDLAATYPDIVTPLVAGISYEGRPIRGIKISHGEGRKIIFIEGGIHSREWISPATVIYMTNELLTSDNEDAKAAANDFDWYIFPVTNPDGYIWTHTEFRLWRKNRRPVGNEFGIDLNRNWNNNWLQIGASLNPASNTYAGAGPFSEPETRHLSTFIRSVGDKIDLYLSFHSSGQLLLLPYGNTTEPLGNYYDAINIGRRAMGALAVRYGTPYTTGNIAEAIYHAAGTSIDWVKDALDVPLVYCYELRDRGVYGHLLPPEQILPTSEETWDSVLDLIYQARRFGYLINDDLDGPNNPSNPDNPDNPDNSGDSDNPEGFEDNSGVAVQGSLVMLVLVVFSWILF